MVKTPLPLQGAQVRSLVDELRSHMLRDVAKKQKQNANNQCSRERKMSVERIVAFNQNAGNLGRWWTRCPQKPSPKFLLGHESF